MSSTPTYHEVVLALVGATELVLVVYHLEGAVLEANDHARVEVSAAPYEDEALADQQLRPRQPPPALRLYLHLEVLAEQHLSHIEPHAHPLAIPHVEGRREELRDARKGWLWGILSFGGFGSQNEGDWSLEDVWDALCGSGFLGNSYDLGAEGLQLEAPRENHH